MATRYITADRKRFVPAGSPDARFGIAESDIDRLKLREAFDEFIKPLEEPEVKMAPKPSNKMRKRGQNKGR